MRGKPGSIRAELNRWSSENFVTGVSPDFRGRSFARPVRGKDWDARNPRCWAFGGIEPRRDRERKRHVVSIHGCRWYTTTVRARWLWRSTTRRRSKGVKGGRRRARAAGKGYQPLAIGEGETKSQWGRRNHEDGIVHHHHYHHHLHRRCYPSSSRVGGGSDLVSVHASRFRAVLVEGYNPGL